MAVNVSCHDMRGTESLEVAGVVLRPAATELLDRACASVLSLALLPPEILPEIAVAVATAQITQAVATARIQLHHRQPQLQIQLQLAEKNHISYTPKRQFHKVIELYHHR